jgi:hypothetical protein
MSSVPALLADIRALKLDLARLDPRAGMPVRPPLGASPAAIASVERRMGRAIPPGHRALLALHDGFPHLYQGASLLSAQQLARGAYVDLARMVIENGEGAVDERPKRKPTLFPFGIDARAETIFAFDLGEAREGGEIGIVIWMNEIGLRVESFQAFLETVREMLRGDLAERGAVVAEVDPDRPSRRRAVYRCELFGERAAAEIVFGGEAGGELGFFAA